MGAVIAGEALSLRPGRHIAAIRRQWNAAALWEAANHRLQHVLAAAAQTPYYRDAGLCDAVRSVSSIDELATTLPTLPRNQLRRESQLFLSANMPLRRTEVTITTGTQGAASHVVRPRAMRRDQAACERRWFAGLGLPQIFDLTVVTPWQGRPRTNSPFHDLSVGRFDAGVAETVADLNSGRSVGSFLLTTPDVLEAMAAQVKDWSTVTAVGSSFEVLTSAARQRWCVQPRPPLAEMYCASEIGPAIALSYPGCTGMHVNSDYVHLEISSPDGGPVPAGQAGLVTVTDLTNTAMPLLRYQIGDVGLCLPATSCGCGRATPLVRIYGRYDAPIKVGGKLISPMTIRQRLGRGAWIVEQPAPGKVVMRRGEGDAGTAPALASLLDSATQVELGALPAELMHLSRPAGAVLVSAPREPVAEHAGVIVNPAAFGAQPTMRSLSAPGTSVRSRARRTLAAHYARRGELTSLKVLDASRSMSPLFGSQVHVNVRWGTGGQLPERGCVLLMELAGELLVVHRVADVEGTAAEGRILQVADNYRLSSEQSAFWVPGGAALGTVVGFWVARQRYHDLTTPAARWWSRRLAASGRLLVAARAHSGLGFRTLPFWLLHRALAYANGAWVRLSGGRAAPDGNETTWR